MRRVIAAVPVAALLSFVPLTAVTAHTLKIDGTIGVVLHSEPNDELVARRPVTFMVDIQDRSGRFDPAKPASCDCVLTVVKDGAQIARMAVAVGDAYVPLNFTFNEGGIYTVAVSGTPKTAGAFQSFSVEYPSYVKTGSLKAIAVPLSNQLRDALPFVVLGGGILLLLLVIDPLKLRRK